MSLDNPSLAHTSWNCKYHIVFAPKYRRKEFYGLRRLEIGAILRKLSEWKQITIHEAEVCPGHVHMLVSGYYVDTVGKNTAKIAERIRHQLEEDKAVVQLTIDFDGDPFNG